ncbi:MAG: hypothetical protein SAJ37_00785 [Oscillatoria sp. PMC 1068.18]|nr:hypothetical protein [Oscillatoria sp. PMC 1076.18]MEC4987256.1 hypothetical protein [Oscillatoria sp. PMC 1068.18]
MVIENYATVTKSLLIASVATVVMSHPPASAATISGFTDYYDPSNWTLRNINADGSVNSSNAPNSIRVIGSNNFSDSFGITNYRIRIPTDGIVSFNWAYFSSDSSGTDSGGYFNGSSFVELSSTNGQSGSVSIPFSAGDIFAFSVSTDNNRGGRGRLIVGGFSAPAAAVPFEFSPGLGIAILCAMFGVDWARKQLATKKKLPSFTEVETEKALVKLP